MNQTKKSETLSYIEGTIVMIVRLDAFIATTISILRQAGADNVGADRQKIYYEIISVFPPTAHNQVLRHVAACTEEWCIEESSNFALRVDANGEQKIAPTPRKETVRV